MCADARTALDELAAAAIHVRHRRALAAAGGGVRNVEFWRDLNPRLTVSDAAPSAGVRVSDHEADRVAAGAEQLRVEGYLHVPALFPPAVIAPIRDGIGRIVAAGLPAAFIFVYDETFALCARAGALAHAIVGARPRLLARECWAFQVPPGDPAMTRWSAFRPHRDWLAPDPGVLAHDLPTVLSVWIPLVDVTPLDSCMYVVPADCDADYYESEYRYDPGSIRLQDIRALPAPAGSMLAWTTHLMHWGSRSSAFSTTTRLSVTCDLQRRDASGFGRTIDLDEPVPFVDRVAQMCDLLESQVPAIASDTLKARS